MAFINVAFYSFVAGLSTIAGVYLVRRFGKWTRKNARYLISLAVGVLMGNAFFHLIPESQKLTNNWSYYVIVGFFVLFLVEHFMIFHACQEEECDIHTLGAVGTLGIGFHSLVDGLVIGIGFATSFFLGVLNSLAVIFHEVPEGAFTYTLLIYDKVPERRTLFYSWLVALATPFGAITSFLLIRTTSESSLGVLLALAAGTFIYIGASDLIPQAHRRPNPIHAVLVLAGIGLVLLLGTFLEV